MTPERFLEEFDRLFLAEKKRILAEHSALRFMGKKPEAYSLEFGVESATLNRKLRELIREPENPREESGESKVLRMRLKWAYAYWWNRVHLLEKLAASHLGEAKVKKNMEKGGRTLKKLIAGEVGVEQIHPQFKALIEALNRMRVEDAGFIKQSEELLKGD